MIPKNLFMIWVGESIPNWAKNSHDAFRCFNEEFNDIFIHITDFIFDICDNKFIEVKYNQDLLEGRGISLNRTLSNLNKNLSDPKSFIYWKYRQNVNDLKITNYKVILSDLLRSQLLFDYGGIYVDCDALPRKRFDDKLLRRKQFFASSYYGLIRVVRDNFFLGSEPNRWINFSYWRVLLGDMCYPIRYDLSRNNERAREFFNGKIKVDSCIYDKSITQHGYIDHFFNRGWATKSNNIE